MAQQDNVNGKKEDKVEKVKPTLYLSLGGTGMEICLRLRRRILNAVWGTNSPRRASSLAEFPVAQFINFDLDSGSIVESGKSAKTDILSDLLAFTDEEKLIERLDLNKYTKSDADLSRYPHVVSWFPLTPEKVKALQIDPAKGAGQIRAISRLYFFDKFGTIKNKIRGKIDVLKNSIGNKERLRQFGLDTEEQAFRIVIIASTAGGTGSGSFIDMGYLAKSLIKNDKASVDLYLMLPSGYTSANKERVEGNTYAALMELETCMRGDSRMVESWDGSLADIPDNQKPFDDVYLIDTGNLAGKQTSDVKDIYDMLADALFEDFASADFANKKRSVAVNQQQHKISPYKIRLPIEQFGTDSYIKFQGAYSTIGQASIDTQIDSKRDIKINKYVSGMLKAFFGFAAKDQLINRANDDQRDEFVREYLHLNRIIVKELPAFNKSKPEFKVYKNGDFSHFEIADRLLNAEGEDSILGQIENNINQHFDKLRSESNKDEWPRLLEDIIKLAERDTQNKMGGADRNLELRIQENRVQLTKAILSEAHLAAQLYMRLDNKERGGLDYTQSLVEMIKDYITNDVTGVIRTLNNNADIFAELSEALKVKEMPCYYEDLKETRGKSLIAFIRNKDAEAETAVQHIQRVLRERLQCYVKSVACKEAVILLQDVDQWLGNKVGVADNGATIWSGFIGTLQEGRDIVSQVISEADYDISRIEQSMRDKHATLIILPSAVDDQNYDESAISESQFKEFAEDAFKDFGGSKELFSQLETPEGKADILSRLRNKALNSFPRETYNQENPLFAALEKLSPAERKEKFSNWLALAMPWVQYNRQGDFGFAADRFKAIVGVADAGNFEKKYRHEIEQCIPTQAGITGSQLAIVDSGKPGKLVCYVELSGIALPPMQKMELWHESYRSLQDPDSNASGAGIPLHTHKRITMFVHPQQFSAKQYEARAEDFLLFLKAIALGVLKRNPKLKRYEILVKGQSFAVRDEAAITQNGFIGNSHKQKIIDQVMEKSSNITSPLQYACLYRLFDYFAERAYQPRKVSKEDSEERLDESWQHTLLRNKLVQESKDLLFSLSTGTSGLGPEQLIKLADDSIEKWSTPLEGSKEDVSESDAAESRSDKRALVSDFFSPGWIDAQLIATSNSNQGNTNLNTFGQMPTGTPLQVPPPSPMMPGMPPPAHPSYQYHITTAGQTYGPYILSQLQSFSGTGQLTAQSFVWREGLAGWLPASQVPELATLFIPTPAMGGMPPPPPMI